MSYGYVLSNTCCIFAELYENKYSTNEINKSIMDRKVVYVSPDLKEIGLYQEGVLCSSEQTGTIGQLTEKDWSDEMGWE